MTAPFRRIDAFALRPTGKTVWTFLRVVDGDGFEGWGEATLTGQEAALAVAHGRIAVTLAGTRADMRRDLMTELGVSNADKPAAAIVSAVDQALWDIEGKRRARPMHALLGGTPLPSVGVYANVNRRTTDRTPAGFAASARKALGDGYSAFKIAPFDGAKPGSTDGIAHGIACAAAVRAAIGPERKLMIDCHWRFDERTAGIALAELGQLDLHWFECPIAETPGNYDALRRLRRAANDIGALLAGCEMETGVAGFRPFIEREVYDVIMPDVKYAGGLAEFGRIADLAAARGIKVAPHNPSGPISHVASLHLGAVLPGFLSLEHQYDETERFFSIVADAMPRPKDGESRLPTGPGLGVALDTEQLVPLAELPAPVAGDAR